MEAYKTSIKQLAAHLNYGEERLMDIIKNAPKYYSPFHIVVTKQNGDEKTRHIDNPNKKYPLRALQKAINKQLLVPEVGKIDMALVGGIKGRNMMKHVEPHVAKKTVVCLDLSNCFPNISYRRVVRVWRSLGYSSALAKLLASATTYRGYLPQGAPTSSLLCNFALNPMAIAIRRQAERNQASYTQYIDDICLSGDDESARKMINHVFWVAAKFGQRINKTKKEIMDSKHRQMFMGIGVNTKAKINAKTISAITARINEIDASGFIDRYTNLSIAGQILYVKRVQPQAGKRLEGLLNSKVNGIYEGGTKPKKGSVRPCWDYRKDVSKRKKCHYLTK